MDVKTENVSDGELHIELRKRRKDRSDDKDKSVEGPKTNKQLNVTLGDCLACSGCITSAEAVLISEQSHEKVMKVLEDKEKVCLH